MRDPYIILGVAKTADEKQIKSAFRKLAMRYHPDHNKDDPKAQEKFAEINQAYEILSDKDKRGQFDRGEIDAEGKPRFQGGFGGGAGGFSGAGAGGRGGNPFEGFDFGGGNGRGGAGGFGNVHIDESVFGDIFGRGGFGGGAGGFGGAGGRGGFGAGARRQPQRGADIEAALNVSLAQIIGAEKVEAVFSDGKRLNIKLPAYLEDGQTIRLKGQGQAVSGGVSGDALITIRFKIEDGLRLDGRAVHMDLPIGLKTAVRGGKETVKTLDGAVSLAIPAWSSSDKVLRLKDKGLPLKAGGRAPLYVHLRLMLPETPDRELEEWAAKQ